MTTKKSLKANSMPNARKVKIYVLEDAITGNPFYVGATIQELKKRVMVKDYKFPETVKKFIAYVLEECEVSEAGWTEFLWIQLFRSWGFTLINKTKQQYPVRYISSIVANEVIENKVAA